MMTNNLPEHNAPRPPRGPSGRLAQPELLNVRRQLRKAAIDGDTTAALALSNFELIDQMKRQAKASKPRNVAR